MNEHIRILAEASGMKLTDFYPDEKKTMGWVIVNCTEFELERYTATIFKAKEDILKAEKNTEGEPTE